MIHPADVRGPWTRRRQWVFAVLVLFLVLGPVLPIGGHPMIMLDVEHRSFYLFGGTFNAQDFWMVLLFLLASVFGVLFLTAWHGRLWCGWACPQTVFMEGLIRPIERFFEGPRERRMKLASEPWTAGKIARRVAKLTAFLLVSTTIAHTFAAVFVSPKELWLMINEGPMKHMEAFSLTTAFAAALMFEFTWFREQFCVVVCPYGRGLSWLHDKDSIVVSYDAKRGEPRGKVVRDPPPGEKKGDCVDCKRCIHVCPTGIDIRNGLQMECLACNQCIDACDEVMTKLNRAPGLIRFASGNELSGKPRKVLRPRLFLYGALTAISVVSLGVALTMRTPFEANVFRARGANPFILDGDVVRMPFQIHVFNKNTAPSKFRILVTTPVPSEVVVGMEALELNSLTDSFVPVTVSIDRKHLAKDVDVHVLVKDDTTGADKDLTVRFLKPFGYGPKPGDEREHGHRGEKDKEGEKGEK